MAWRAYDPDLEWRRHVWFGLEKMSPAGRVGFIRRLCKLAPGHAGIAVDVTSHTGTLTEAFSDVQTLALLHGLGTDRVAVEMEKVLRQG